MNGNNSNRKWVYRIVSFISIIFLFIMLCGFFALNELFNPFKTKEEKQVKPIYKAAMKGVSGFRLTSVSIDNDYDRVFINLRLKGRTSPQYFTEEELQEIYLATKQLEGYLNDNDWPSMLYEEYILRIKFGRSPHILDCSVKYIDEIAVFYYLYSDTANYITDFYMMEDVSITSTRCSFDGTLDKGKAEKISKFENLEKIYFRQYVDEKPLIEFARIINKNNPECKIFLSDKEYILPD